jgi:hypothetical protein
MPRVWKKLGLGLVVVTVGTGACAYWQRDTIAVQYAAYQVTRTPSDEERIAHARTLLDLDGEAAFLALYQSDDAKLSTAANAAFVAKFGTASDTDVSLAHWSRLLLSKSAGFPDAGQRAVLELVEVFLRTNTATDCQPLVKLALARDTETKLRAMPLARHPKLKLFTDLVPLLKDPDARVRREAMYTLGPVIDDATPWVSEEELFVFLHDTDAEVRETCTSALKSRGLGLAQISLARQLTHPDPTERMNLLNDLATGDLVNDPGPWLERLSRDSDPAVRLGVARVAFEVKLRTKTWLTSLAGSDPDPTVRRWATYYQRLSDGVQQTQFEK